MESSFVVIKIRSVHKRVEFNLSYYLKLYYVSTVVSTIVIFNRPTILYCENKYNFSLLQMWEKSVKGN